MDAYAMRKRASAARGLEDRRLGGKAAASYRVERGADALEVTEHRLVHAFSQHEVRDSIVDVEEACRFEVERLLLVRGWRGQSRLGKRIRLRTRRLHVPRERQSVDGKPPVAITGARERKP